MMTLTELRYLVTLAETGHFGRAAEICHVSQPTLSIALKKLEEKLGISLIERSKNHIFPTAIGEQVIQQARLVLSQARMVEEIASAGKDSLSTPLKLGAIFTIGPYLFPHLLPELKRLAPDMPLVLEESYTEVLRSKLVDAALDVILIALPFTESDVVTRKLYDEPFVVLMPKDHPWAEQRTINIDQLTEETVLLLGEGHCFRDQVLNACPHLKEQMQKETYPIAASANTSLDTLKHMVASGLGITVLPLSAAGLYGYNQEQLCIRPFNGDSIPTRTVALAWRASFPRFKAIDTLCDAVNKCSVL
ncbi:Hydrogen peroxide-inducible genes activator [BD1-7 clade bacterium]|uniref:Hydrogen peroxide-inducible genes activator n=1 Tax=BD1-7 clade bacterium TaxID=2029982 RepID=A0A5S9MXH4_9GAMM|nr:Hydrogen peroxide-inducible genes activator [BD1-7 clade bacterium]CAA0082775.1 Hydrogen peroxide-inducible genes activator [BD1-7 clade bacterium]